MNTKQANKLVSTILKKTEPLIAGVVVKAMKAVTLRKFSDDDRTVLRQMLAYRLGRHLAYCFAMESLRKEKPC